jgi:hypothetical protein
MWIAYRHDQYLEAVIKKEGTFLFIAKALGNSNQLLSSLIPNRALTARRSPTRPLTSPSPGL